jgi:FMN phosphatase YigB (HAD superfamily)
MMNPIVVFDLDGVLLDFESAWAQCAAWDLAGPIRKVSDAYDLQERYALSSREYRRVWQAFHRSSWWERVQTCTSAWDTICNVEAAGASIWAVTNVNAQWVHARAISLGGLIPSGRIICLGEHASAHHRAEILETLHAQAFIDDRVANANAAVGIIAAPVLLHHGYQGQEEPAHGVTVIDDLLDFPVVIDSLFKAARSA